MNNAIHLLAGLEKIFIASKPMGLAASFAAGFLVSFSPCIYPLIPITVSIVGAASASTRSKGFILSAVFVSGICLTYTALGVTAAAMGKIFGGFFINPVAYLALGVIFLFLGLSLIGVFKKDLFSFSFNYSPGRGLFSLFVLGCVSGLAIIPCSYPVLGAILSLIALKRDIAYGAISLFLFSLGYGTILIILGTFSSLIRKLPKQGAWLLMVKKGMGVVLIIFAGYFFLKLKESLLP